MPCTHCAGGGCPAYAAVARMGIIPDTLLDFHDRARLLVRTLSKDKFCCFVRIASIVMAGFLNKVILLLPQHTTIAREQMLMACVEPLVLKMP